ncbi:uncharacterized protein LOC132721419 [Ruditapes philippinarum]|uniref:uncharacterized protein LOC132721419 n=1 Tax=Ruditapes philippinarum TaxID=129788 RepID=UPI00295B5DAB|nr:uncharacterized protein LOC132721419 [Ruditapes philippinarum]
MNKLHLNTNIMEIEYGSDAVTELESMLEKHDIPTVEDKLKFLESVKQISAFIRSETESCSLEDSGITLVDVIRGALFIADVALKIADFAPFSFPIKVVFKVLLGISNLIFGRKIISNTVQGFQTILDHEIIGNARTRLYDYKTRLIYIQGVVDDVKRAETQHEIDKLLADVGNEESVMAGIKDISLVETKIEDILHEGDLDQFSKLMTQVELYCSLTNLHEILLLYRIAILASHKRQTGRLVRLLYANRQNHENVLAFLYKPTRKVVGFFLKFNEKNYPLTMAFLQHRGLSYVMLKKLFYLLDGQRYEIISEKYTDTKLFIKDALILTCARCTPEKSNDPKTKLELQSGGNNTFEIIGSEMLLSDGLWVKGSYKSNTATKWRVILVEGDTPGDEPCYMFSPVSSESTQFMCVDWTYRVITTTFSHGDETFFWKIKRVDL